MKTLALFACCVLALATNSISAQEVKVGGHLGAVGSMEGDANAIGYGVNLLVVPSGWAGLQLDATMAYFNGGTYFASSPAIVLFPVNMGEIRAGIMAGPGFYKEPARSLKFGFNLGAMGEFNINDHFNVGMMGRWHPVLGTYDMFDVFVTLGYKFDMGGGW